LLKLVCAQVSNVLTMMMKIIIIISSINTTGCFTLSLNIILLKQKCIYIYIYIYQNFQRQFAYSQKS
jgi:hypothetical protein